MSFQVRVDATNPGQFFGCCGLLELAYQLTGEATGCFEGVHFHVEAECSLTGLLDRLTATPLVQVDLEDQTSSPLHIPVPFDFRVDWWGDNLAGGRRLKVWAGTMQSVRIAQAMVSALRDPALHDEFLFDVARVVYDPAEPSKKVEPYYFDARRAPNAHSRDLGFSPNDLELTTHAYPAVEAFCLFGLQRCRPAPVPSMQRIFDYRTWSSPLPPSVLGAVVSGAVPLAGTRTYQFENWYRTNQKKHKAFRQAVLRAQGDE
jgi:CRISPR-associated protein Csb3